MLDGIRVPSIPTCEIHPCGLQPPRQFFFTPGPARLEMIDASPYRDSVKTCKNNDLFP